MKIQQTLWIAIVLLFVTCNPNEPEKPAIKNELKVTVYDTKTWTPSSTTLKTAENVTVKLSSKSYNATAVTNEQGVAVFQDVKEGNYFILATKDVLSNLYNQKTADGVTLGHLIVGVYNSQEEIDSWAAYSNAKIGGIKLADINRDGLIDNSDLISGNPLTYEFKYKDLNNDGVIDAKDIVDGSLQKKDNLVEVKVYIGN